MLWAAQAARYQWCLAERNLLLVSCELILAQTLTYVKLVIKNKYKDDAEPHRYRMPQFGFSLGSMQMGLLTPIQGPL